MEEKEYIYYAVFYAKDGTIHLWPAETKEECEDMLKRMMKNKDRFDYCEATTIIKRGKDSMPEGRVFGIKSTTNFKKEKFEL